MIEVKGEGQISAKIIAHSESSVDGKEIITYELEYHRYIHSELMTHRLFSRNAASSRAIPVKKMLKMVNEEPMMPIHWGANQRGMQAEEECTEEVFISPDNLSREEAWRTAAEAAAIIASGMDKAGYHKQIVNRLLEPFQRMKTIVTATEFDNFFWLRRDEHAQPEIRELADCMWEAYTKSEPEVLDPTEWHVPYVKTKSLLEEGVASRYYVLDEIGRQVPLSIEEALKLSASCCAQVSYRVLDDSSDKAEGIHKKLLSGSRVHASPFEHQATPIPFSIYRGSPWPSGVTHLDKNMNFWSGNLKGWVQYRQTLDNHVCWNYEED